jgi:RNA-directed DNA polymerase
VVQKLGQLHKRVNEWAQEIQNKICLKDISTIFCQKIRGHAQYYGISHNTKYVEIFIEKATRILFKRLNRRSQKKSITWEQFRKFQKKFPLPLARVYYAIF